MNITNIPSPRAPLIDGRTGLISHEWYLFLLNLFTLAGSGQNTATITDLLIAPLSSTAGEPQSIEILSTQESRLAEFQKQVESIEIAPVVTAQLTEIQVQLEALTHSYAEQLQQVGELYKRLQALELQPNSESVIVDLMTNLLPAATTSGYTGTVTTASLVGKTLTITDGIITAFA